MTFRVGRRQGQGDGAIGSGLVQPAEFIAGAATGLPGVRATAVPLQSLTAIGVRGRPVFQRQVGGGPLQPGVGVGGVQQYGRVQFGQGHFVAPQQRQRLAPAPTHAGISRVYQIGQVQLGQRGVGVAAIQPAIRPAEQVIQRRFGCPARNGHSGKGRPMRRRFAEPGRSLASPTRPGWACLSLRYFFGALLPRPPPEGRPVVLGALAGRPLPPRPPPRPPPPRPPFIIGVAITGPPSAADFYPRRVNRAIQCTTAGFLMESARIRRGGANPARRHRRGRPPAPAPFAAPGQKARLCE